MLFTSGTVCGFRFYQEYATTVIAHEQLRTAHLEAELTLLRGQLNPHFVFNMMNGIHVLIQRDARQAADMVLEFSDMLRFQLYDCSQPFISIQQEINYLQHYVSVERKRRGDVLKVDCYWGDALPSGYISPLILTPFIENAFKHVSCGEGTAGFIRVSLYVEGHQLFLTVDNSRESLPAIPDPLHRGKGIGLANVKKRLSLLYPGRHLLQIKETAERFAVFLEIDISPQYPKQHN
ncbi:histidine kinase [Chitinophaga pendula]|uniref:sensor histidine kinase n=1 Tax=Chitinophaga TaxID=79328 RepID=UPI0012FE2698|nr:MULTISPECIES: histidine kinase [Chitinophaga]UCJ05111.1 histidine kinase [Chitinophaga pendula]